MPIQSVLLAKSFFSVEAVNVVLFANKEREQALVLHPSQVT